MKIHAAGAFIAALGCSWVESEPLPWVKVQGGWVSDAEHGALEYQKVVSVQEDVGLFTLYHQDPDPKKSWKLGIGKGSQIYSIEALGSELIGAQTPEGVWIDRVLQTVAVCSAKNMPEKPYFIHQAGTYRAPLKGIDFPVWSPMLADRFDLRERTLSTIVRPLQAHIYKDIPWESHLFLQQHIRDAGDGVIEITYIYTNFGTDLIDFVSLPWGAFSKEQLPVYVRGLPQGSWEYISPCDWVDNLYDMRSGGSWFAMMPSRRPESPGLAVVFGKDPARISGNDRVRWGPVQQEDLTVLEVLPELMLESGKTYFMRYFLVVGHSLDKLPQLAQRLTKHVGWGELTVKTTSTQ